MQWGDEGKGKVIDLLSERASHIARSQGGNNAGHTIVAKGQEYKFHLIPSGILYPHTQCYIGGGTVIDPASFLQEVEGLAKRSVSFRGRLHLSLYAHVVFPYHKKLDLLSEESKGLFAVGTTGRGIGPCYADKANRWGIRVADLVAPNFAERLKVTLAAKNREITLLYGCEPLAYEPMCEEYQGYAKALLEFIAPVEDLLFEASQREDRILFEGAQGALLDTTFGTYPYVTSSCTLAGGMATGMGIGPSRINRVIGVTKAYTTRVGNGPFPTELTQAQLQHFPGHAEARELGTTTGRKRRMGWFDACLVRHALKLNGADSLAITKLDILDGIDEIFICSGYRKMKHFPVTQEELRLAEPIYESHPGWKASTRSAFVYDDLPSKARAYLRRIEELIGVPISIVSTGPEREKTLWLDDFFGSIRP
jgi:adenylosuccinate synthase